MYHNPYGNMQWTPATIVLAIIVCVIFVIAHWIIFTKAGEKGWKSIIPILNTYVLFKITWGSGWFFLLLLIPFVNIIVAIVFESHAFS